MRIGIDLIIWNRLKIHAVAPLQTLLDLSGSVELLKRGVFDHRVEATVAIAAHALSTLHIAADILQTHSFEIKLYEPLGKHSFKHRAVGSDILCLEFVNTGAVAHLIEPFKPLIHISAAEVGTAFGCHEIKIGQSENAVRPVFYASYVVGHARVAVTEIGMHILLVPEACLALVVLSEQVRVVTALLRIAGFDN